MNNFVLKQLIQLSNMYRVFLYIIAVVFILSNFSCRKKDDDSTNTEIEKEKRMLSEAVKSFLFRQHSYWVYTNSTNGNLDSLVVIATKNDFCYDAHPKYGGGKYVKEYVETTYNYFVGSQNASYNYWEYAMYDYIKHQGGGEFGQYGQPIFSCTKTIGAEFNGLVLEELFPTMVINGITFNDVRKFKLVAEKQIYPKIFQEDRLLYYSPYVGLVKKVIMPTSGDTTTLELLRWNVIPY